MKCADVNRLLDEYLQGLLPKEHIDDIEQHLGVCPTCSQLLLQDDQELDFLLQTDWYMISSSPKIRTQVMAQLQAHKPDTWLWWLGACAVYVLLWAPSVLFVFARNLLPRVVKGILQLFQVMRSTTEVAKLVAEALQQFSFSNSGLLVVFSSAALIFAAITYMSKGEVSL